MAKGGERDRPEELYPFAEALVRKMKVRHQLQWSEHRVEYAIQDLYLAGWQVWQDEEDVGLAKNRMRDRAKNLLRDFQAKRTHEPKASSEHPKPGVYGRWDEERDEDRVERWNPADRISLLGDPDQEAMVNEYLDGLTERQRRIILLRTAKECRCHPSVTQFSARKPCVTAGVDDGFGGGTALLNRSGPSSSSNGSSVLSCVILRISLTAPPMLVNRKSTTSRLPTE